MGGEGGGCKTLVDRHGLASVHVSRTQLTQPPRAIQKVGKLCHVRILRIHLACVAHQPFVWVHAVGVLHIEQ